MSAAGALLGLALSAGILLSFGWWRRQYAVPTLDRIAPQLSSGDTSDGMSELLRLALPFTRRTRNDRALESRLRRAGDPRTPAQFRAHQALWAAVAAGIAACLGIVLALDNGSPTGIALLGAFGAATGFIGCDRRLSAHSRARMARVDQQLPAFAELLALACAAGQSPSAALESVSIAMGGDLGHEVRLVIARQRAGAGLESSLRELAHTTATVSAERFVDAMVVALERGTPLADVLRAQSSDIRAAQARSLMEQAGRKDSLMLIPVVFLILPVVVVIAMFPGFSGLQVLVG